MEGVRACMRAFVRLGRETLVYRAFERDCRDIFEDAVRCTIKHSHMLQPHLRAYLAPKLPTALKPKAQ